MTIAKSHPSLIRQSFRLLYLPAKTRLPICWVILAGLLSGATGVGAQQILPLGDSITDGFQITGGYRTQLYKRLTNSGAIFSFLGSQTGNASPVLAAGGQTHHEGHSGYRTDQIYNNLLGNDGTAGNNGGHWLDGGNGTGRSAISPNIVLLHIGTNDRTQGESIPTMANKLAILLNMLATNQPTAKVFVASAIPRTDNATYEADQQVYNALIPGLVAAMGTNFHFVDMHGVVPPTQLADGVHPTQAGYDAMGDAWFDALQGQQGLVGEDDQSNIGNNNVGDPLNSTFYFTSGQTTAPNGALIPSLITGSAVLGNIPDVGSLSGLNDLTACGPGSGGYPNMVYYGNGLFGNSLGGGVAVTNTIALGGASPVPGGYTVSSLLVFGGWSDHASFCDQHYTLSVSRDGTNYVTLRSVNFMPFAAADDLNDAGTQDASTLVTLTNLNANGLAAGIRFVRFVYSAGRDANSQEQEGQLIQEVEVFGAPTFPALSKVVSGKISEFDLSASGDSSGGTNNSQFYFTSGRTANTSAALQANLLTGATVVASTGGADVGSTAAINNGLAGAGTGAIAFYGNTLFGTSLDPANGTTLGKVALTIPLGGGSPSPTGYSLSTLSVFCGWVDHASFSDQNYDVSVSRDGTNYLYLYTVNYMPFLVANDLGSGQSSSSFVLLTNLNASGLATGIRFVRFTLTAGKDANNQAQQGLALQELEVFGTPTPVSPVVESDQSNTGDDNLDAGNSQFYFTSGQSTTTGAALIANLLTGSTVTSSTGGADVGSPATVNDLNAVSGTGAIDYYGNTLFGSSLNPSTALTHGVVTLTIPLGGASPASGGYTLSSVKVFEGWLDHASFNDQHYTVATSTDGTNYTYLHAVDFMPFAAADDLSAFQSASTVVTLTSLNVSGVKAIRFTLSAGTDANGALQQGQLLQEIEVFGSPTGVQPLVPGQINAIIQSNAGDNSGGTNNSQFYFTSGRTANTSAALQANLLTGATVNSSTGGADVGSVAAINNLLAQPGAGAIAYYGNTQFGSSLDPANGTTFGKVVLTVPLGGGSPSATGYTLSSLATFCGWVDHASFSDQNYDVAVSRDGTNYLYLYSVHYLPFLTTNDLGSGQSSSSLVILTNLNAAGLATGIRQVRFSFSAGRDDNSQLQQGLALQEIEVFGTPTPASAVVENDQSNIGDNNNDAGNSQFYFTSGQTTTAGAALSTNLLTGSTVASSTGGADVGTITALNDANAASGVGAVAYYGNTLFGSSLNPSTPLTHGVVTLTMPLGGASPAANGYSLSSIKVFEGWIDHASFNDQHYLVTTSTDRTNYTLLHAVNFMPFLAADDLGGGQSASSLVTLTNLNAVGVKSIRFVLSAGLDANGALQQGQIPQEIEVFGSATPVGSPPPVIASATFSGGSLIFSGTNGLANATFYVLTSTNVAAPLGTWTYASTNVFDANGRFGITNTISSGVPQKFYRLLVP